MTHTSLKHLFLLAIGIILLGVSNQTFAYCPVGSTNCHIASCDTPPSPLNYPLTSQQYQGIGMCDEPSDFGGGDINGGTYTWQCISNDSPNTTPGYPQHTSVANCSVAAKYSGACGTANGTTVSSIPSTNLCSVGTPTAVAGNGPWSWSCNGYNGGASATCSANKTASACTINSIATPQSPIRCNFQWTTGVPAGQTVNPTPQIITNGSCTDISEDTWDYGPGYTNLGDRSVIATTASCNVSTTPINGACGSSNGQTLSGVPTNLCNAGTASAVAGNGPWSWSCNGSNGGSTATCNANISTPTGTGTCTSCVTAKCKDQFGNVVADSLCPVPVPTTGVVSSPAGTQLRCPVGSNSYGWDVGAWSACSNDTTCNNGGGITTTGYIDWLGDPFAWLHPVPANWDASTSGGRVYGDDHSVVMGCPFLLNTNFNMTGPHPQCFTSLNSIPEQGTSSYNGTFYQIFGGNWYTIFVMNDIVISSTLSSSGYGTQTSYPGVLWQSRCYGYNGGIDIAQVCPQTNPGQDNYRENTNVGCNNIDADTLPAHPGTNAVSLCIKVESCQLDPSVKTRTVVCRDNGGTGSIVDDSICSQPKPATTDASTCNIITDLQCGSASNIASLTTPTANLCTSPAALSGSVALLNGSWQWQCRTRGPLGYSSNPTNGGNATACIADLNGECYGRVSSATCTAPQNNTTVNYCGTANGQTYSSLSSTNTNLCAAGAFLQVGSFSPQQNGWGWHCAGSLNPGPTEMVSSCSANQPAGTCTLDTTVGGGCFIADTLINMADGSLKPIQDIKVGDTLKAVNGLNTVVSLLRPLLGHQDIYAINGKNAFFTANHPFLTTDGWKSLDPETTKKEIPDLEVSKLTIGDTLITENGHVIIRSIEHKKSDSSTQLYNFELDGDHTYFANGFAVHNKYEPGHVDANLGDACVLNSDCRSYVAGTPTMACDGIEKVCKYTRPYDTFMCQLDSNGNVTNWYQNAPCGDWAEPNYVGESCPTNGGSIDRCGPYQGEAQCNAGYYFVEGSYDPNGISEGGGIWRSTWHCAQTPNPTNTNEYGICYGCDSNNQGPNGEQCF